MQDNYNILISKIDEFIRKYYKNLLIRGVLYCLTILLVFYIIIILLEYFAHFNTIIRTVLFYSFIFINLYVLWRFVIISIFNLNKIGKIISNEFAAEIIGEHFPEVKDKLLNTLQLRQLCDQSPENKDLIKASIDQKIITLKPIPFASAINLKQNNRYLKFALPPALLLLILLVAAPGLVTEPTERLVKHNTFFEKPLPYRFVIQNKKLETIQQEDFRLDLKINGNEIPETVYIRINETQYKLEKDNTVSFHFVFKNLQKTLQFCFVTEDFVSKYYELSVLPKPTILNFDIELNYPSYVNKKDETINNTGDLIIPAGTKVKWKFFTKDTRTLIFNTKNSNHALSLNAQNSFVFTDVFKESVSYSIRAVNAFVSNKDTLSYLINVIPDAYPTIDVEEYKDSIFQKHFYFKGLIKDDYGFSRLTFNIKKMKADDKKDSLLNKIITHSVPIEKYLIPQQYYYHFDMSSISVNPGDEIEYYFEVWDNDGVNGAKSSLSQKAFFKVPSKQEITQNISETNKKMEKDIQQMINETKGLQKQIDELNKKLVDKKNIGWQEKKQIQELLEKQKQLQTKIENIKQQNQNKNNLEQQYSKPNEDLLKKQEQLEKLFDEVMTDEMKELFKQMEKLLDDMNKDKLREMLDNTKLSNEDIEKALDRNLEIFKQLEFEKKLNDAINNLDETQKKQEQLSKVTNDKNKDAKDLKDKQDKLNEEFKDIRKELNEIEKNNKELENPNNLENTDFKEQQIENDQKNSSEQLKENKKSKASQSQKNAADNMKQLSDKLKKMQEEIMSGGIEENEEALRAILENLVRSSINEENLMNKLQAISISDPQYPKIISEQKKIKDDLQMIEDSLFALSKRQIEIEPIINKEINKINQNIAKALQSLIDMNTIGANYRISDGKGQALSRQQYAMTSINNLALLLSEALEQMQQSMDMPMQGKGQCKSPKSKKKMNCSNPGQGKPSAKSLRQMQEQLNKQLEALKKGMEQGKKPGNNKQSMSEQLARMAAQQAAIREQLRKMADDLKNGGGMKSGDISKLQEEMNKTETDLVNKRINLEMLKRQQEILTRLLESEKAEQEREKDDKRESLEQKNELFSNPKQFFEYNRLKEKKDEMLKTIPPSLNSFYKTKINAYFYKFEK